MLLGVLQVWVACRGRRAVCAVRSRSRAQDELTWLLLELVLYRSSCALVVWHD